MEKNKSFHFVQLLIAILVMSSSGALGKYISLPVPIIIWLRCVLGSFLLFLFLRFLGSLRKLKKGKEFRHVLISSIFLGMHWISYFWALKLSNVAIGMLSMFTYPVITTLLEPLMLKTKYDWVNVVLAIMAFVGVFILVPEFDLANDVTLGIVMGVLSAVTYSLRNIMTKSSVSSLSGTMLMFYQLLFLSVLLIPTAFLFPTDNGLDIIKSQFGFVLLLAFYTTAVGHTLLVRSFAHFSVTTVSIISCLTPLFGIIQGYIFLNEKPTEQVLIGGSIILFSVVVESVRSIRN